MSGFSKYIVYVDESGDHGPVNVNYPMFVLAFCIFEKRTYAKEVTSYMHWLKFKYFGHDAVVLHEHEIRKRTRDFQILMNQGVRDAFYEDLNRTITISKFTIVAAAIHKERLRRQYTKPADPYHLGLRFGLERIERFREAKGDVATLHVVFESRGDKEDAELELEFRRVCQSNRLNKTLDFVPRFAKKSSNHCGLQLADLVARPIGIHVLRPDQPNRAYDLLCPKFRASPQGKIDGWGLKCFP